MRQRHLLVITLGSVLLWQSAAALIPSVVSIILQLLNLGGGGLNFLQLVALVAGAVTMTGLDLGLGLSGFVLAPSILVFAL